MTAPPTIVVPPQSDHHPVIVAHDADGHLVLDCTLHQLLVQLWNDGFPWPREPISIAVDGVPVAPLAMPREEDDA